jgi:hypothetical protein
MVFVPVVVIALLLVPVSQAFAGTGHMTVNMVGTGSGEVESEAGPGIEQGAPPIACSYDGVSAKGVCEDVPALFEAEPGFYVEQLHAVPAVGSEFVGWRVEKGYNVGECLPGGSFFGPTTCIVYNEEENEKEELVINEEYEWVIAAEFKLEPTGPASYELNLSVSPTGSGSFMCKELPSGTEEACAAEYEENKEIEVTEHPVTGHHFEKWEGACTGVGSCVVKMTGEESVIAENALDPESFSLVKNGKGTVQCEDITAASGPGACAASYPYGHQVKVLVTPETGWRLEDLTGTGSANACSVSSCVFTIEEPSSVTVELGLVSHPSTLTVFKDGNGQGSVTIAPGRAGEVKCSPASTECEATFEEGEMIELEQAAAHGSTFAGWLGCRPVPSSDRCRITLNGSEPEVTAVFLTEGVQGETPTLSEFDGTHEPAGNPCKGRGGVQISTATETKYACDGTIGKDGEKGEQGEIGFPGETGPAGAQGSQGLAGSVGANGAQGAQGAQGPAGSQGSQGPQGKQGPVGKVTVTCRVTGSKKVVCSVKNAKASASSLRWTLRRSSGHLIRYGNTDAKRLEHVLNHLSHGHYVLHLDGRDTTIAIPTGSHANGGHHHA